MLLALGYFLVLASPLVLCVQSVLYIASKSMTFGLLVSDQPMRKMGAIILATGTHTVLH